MEFNSQDLFRVFSAQLSSRYPGNSINVEFIVLRAWLENIPSGIEGACKNYIDSELSKFSDEADYSEFRHVYDIAEEELPRIINLSTLVSIVALFENAMGRLLSFCSRQENIEFKLNRESLANKFNEFISKKLSFEYKFDETFLEKAGDITFIRNTVAHGAATICAFSLVEKTDFERVNEEKLLEVVARSSDSLSFDRGQLKITQTYLIDCFELFESQTKNFMDFIERRYFK